MFAYIASSSRSLTRSMILIILNVYPRKKKKEKKKKTHKERDYNLIKKVKQIKLLVTWQHTREWDELTSMPRNLSEKFEPVLSSTGYLKLNPSNRIEENNRNICDKIIKKSKIKICVILLWWLDYVLPPTSAQYIQVYIDESQFSRWGKKKKHLKSKWVLNLVNLQSYQEFWWFLIVKSICNPTKNSRNYLVAKCFEVDLQDPMNSMQSDELSTQMRILFS